MPTMRSHRDDSIIGSEHDRPQPPDPIDEVAFWVHVKSAHRVLNSALYYSGASDSFDDPD
jgi:hypothetical protein